MTKDFPFRDHQDSYLDMVSRRRINEEYAEQPVDFNEQGLRLAAEHVDIGEDEAILDIGCSSGRFVLEAAQATSTQAKIYGLEPDFEIINFLPDHIDDSKFTFLHGMGENIPLPDNTVRVATAHNVLFRAHSIPRMLEEMRRVTEPGGVLAISTNARYHAFWRHTFERVVAKVMAEQISQPVETPSIPAAGCYLEDLPEIVEQNGGLKIIGELNQFCAAVITADRVDDYVRPIALSVNRTGLDPRMRSQWRAVSEDIVRPFVMNKIAKMDERNQEQGVDAEPYFADVVHRGMILARNIKT